MYGSRLLTDLQLILVDEKLVAGGMGRGTDTKGARTIGEYGGERGNGENGEERLQPHKDSKQEWQFCGNLNHEVYGSLDIYIR